MYNFFLFNCLYYKAVLTVFPCFFIVCSVLYRIENFIIYVAEAISISKLYIFILYKYSTKNKCLKSLSYRLCICHSFVEKSEVTETNNKFEKQKSLKYCYLILRDY